MPRSPKHLSLSFGLLWGSACQPGAEPAKDTDGHTPVLLSMSDISVLYPLPATSEDPNHLRASDDGAYGTLFPRELFLQIPTFPATTDETLVLRLLRVVSLRFDACGGTPDDCRPEVRLVMQPIAEDGRAADSALHLFYAIDDFDAAVAALRELRALEPETAVDAPLDVHPSLVAQGVGGAYGAALREVVLGLTGEDRLRRVTFFLRAPSTTPNWFMGGFEVEEGVMTTLDIEGVADSIQQVLLTETGTTFAYDVNPPGASPEDGRAFFSTEAMAAATDAERQATMASYLRVDNPAVYVPDQLSCVGCHLSTVVTTAAERDYGLQASDFPDDAYTSTARDLQLRGGAGANATSLRGFGWFDFDAMISRRTVNETAHTLDKIEADYPDVR